MRDFTLHELAAMGDVEGCLRLLDANVPVDQTDKAGRTALHYAAMAMHANVLEELLSRGADANSVTKTGCSALHYVATGLRYELSGDSGRDLQLADEVHVCARDDARCQQSLDTLLRHGASASRTTQRGMGALHMAARACPALVTSLLDVGCPVDAASRDGWTPLHEACSHGTIVCARTLVNRGADVCAATKRGVTPLHEAARRASRAVCQLLVGKGADTARADGVRDGSGGG
eukprot:m.241187 g.241187  ORF g.241187 m.241187 type:complete len:233 (+) comp13802_c0_seq1:80-778(+)